MRILKAWPARVAAVGMGWNLKRGPEGVYHVSFTVRLTDDVPNVHVGRLVEVTMPWSDALALADSLVRAAHQAQAETRRL